MGTHGQYMQSASWRARKVRYWRDHRRKCHCCNALSSPGKAIHLHHLSYDNIGNEPDEDLMPLCEDCHDLVHAFAKQRPELSLRDATMFGIAHILKARSKRRKEGGESLNPKPVRDRVPLGTPIPHPELTSRQIVLDDSTIFVPVNQRVDEHERRYAPTGGAEARLDGIPVIKPVPTIERVKVKPAPEDMPTRRRPCQKGWSRKAINKILSNEWFPTSSCWFCGGTKKKKMDFHFYPDGEEKILVCTGCHKGFHTQEDRYPHVSHDDLLQAYRSKKRAIPTGGPAAQLNGLPIVEIPGRAQQVSKEPPTKKVKHPCYESLSTTQRNKRAKELWNHQHACRTCGTLRRLEIHIDDDGGDLFLCGRCHEGVHQQMELHPEASSQAVIQAYARLRAAKTTTRR